MIREAEFFVMVTESEAQQRALLEKFVDDALAFNKRNCIQGDPPMIYREMIVLASDVTRNYNGRQSDLWRKIDAYGAYRSVKKKDAELDAKRAEIVTLRQTVSNLQSLGFGGNRQPKTDKVFDRKKGRPKTGGLEPILDMAYIKDRSEVCKEWNTPGDCTRGSFSVT